MTQILRESYGRDLTVQVSNEFRYAHWKHDELMSVVFQYADLSQLAHQSSSSKVINNALLEFHKSDNRFTIKVHNVTSDSCRLESIILDYRESEATTESSESGSGNSDAAVAVDEQRIDVTSVSEVISIPSSVHEYSLYIRFRITEDIVGGAVIEERIETPGVSHIRQQKVDNLTLDEDGKPKSFDVKIAQRKVRSSRLSDTHVVIRLLAGNQKVLFDSRFSYCVETKRGKRVAKLSKLFSKFA